MNAQEAVTVLTDEAIRRGADANDDNGIVRGLIFEHELGFYAWFCVCCEIADRQARAEGFANQGERAMRRALGAVL